MNFSEAQEAEQRFVKLLPVVGWFRWLIDLATKLTCQHICPLENVLKFEKIS